MPAIEVNGLLSLYSQSGAPAKSGPLTLTFNDAPKGMLVITNNTTGATKSIKLAQASYGQVVWDWATDDPSSAAGNLMTFELHGNFGSETRIHYDDGFTDPKPVMFRVAGSGSGKISGYTVTA